MKRLSVLLFCFTLFLSCSIAEDLSCRLCRGIVPYMQSSLKARRPIDVDAICQPFGEENLASCLDFLTIYGQTLLKKISRGDEAICDSLYDRDLVSVLLGSTSYLCADVESAAQSKDERPKTIVETRQTDIKIPKAQVNQMNMNFLLHIEMSQVTKTEKIEDNQVTSSTTVLQESETTFFQDPNGDIWREDHTQVFKTDESSEQVAFLDLYSVAKVDSDDSAFFDSLSLDDVSGGTGEIPDFTDDVIMEMRSEKTSIYTERGATQGRQNSFAFIGIQAITFFTLITAFMGVLYGLNNLPTTLGGRDEESEDDEDEVDHDQEGEQKVTLLIDYEASELDDNEKRRYEQQLEVLKEQRKYEIDLFFPQVKLDRSDAL